MDTANKGPGKSMMNRMKNAGKKLTNVRNKIGAKAMNLTYRIKNAYNSTIYKGGKTRKASGRKHRGGAPPPPPSMPKPVSLQRMNELRKAVPEINKLNVAKRLIEKLWPGFTCTTPTITVELAGIQTIKQHIEAMIEDLNAGIMNESTAKSAVKNAAKSALSFLKSKTTMLGNLGKAQVASKLDTIKFLNSMLSNTTLEIPCEEAKLLAIRLVTFYDLNPLDYSGMNKGSKHVAANTRKAAREELRDLAKYYRTNTNIMKSFIKKYAIDEDDESEIESALRVSMESNTNGKKVVPVQQILDELKKALAARRKASQSTQGNGSTRNAAQVAMGVGSLFF